MKHIQYQQKGSLTIRRVTGEPGLDEMLEGMWSIYRDPTPDVCWILADRCSLRHLSPEDVRQVSLEARKVAESRAGGKTAVVAMGDLEFGLSRVAETMGQTLQMPFEVRAFRSLSRAAEWLGVSVETLRDPENVEAK